ncbi:hypothetical protein ARMGADRAFT_1037633 [Armillaria gallica]|uniref:Uncharacterized protein n=1 Tax=Armillaria gallica TaxID=47427 RepID=A0A2H3D8L1_ARMGA|nr:hypothetical protein ARMGADRAFT_1037633 [Armillaria gallica]
MTIVIKSNSDSEGKFKFVKCLERPNDPNMQALTSRMSETTLVTSVSSETNVNPTTGDGNLVTKHIYSQGYSKSGQDHTLYTVQSYFISDWSLAARISQTNGHTVKALKEHKKRQTPTAVYTVLRFSRIPAMFKTPNLSSRDSCQAEPGSIPVFSELLSRESNYDMPLSHAHFLFSLEASIQTLGIIDAMAGSFETLQLTWEKFRLALRNSAVEIELVIKQSNPLHCVIIIA